MERGAEADREKEEGERTTPSSSPPPPPLPPLSTGWKRGGGEQASKADDCDDGLDSPSSPWAGWVMRFASARKEGRKEGKGNERRRESLQIFFIRARGEEGLHSPPRPHYLVGVRPLQERREGPPLLPKKVGEVHLGR